MKQFFHIHFVFLVLLCQSISGNAQDYTDLYPELYKSAPNIKEAALRSALLATQCAVHSGLEAPKRLAVIDFSLPSNVRRLWIFDLEERSLLFRELVAHGRNSGVRMSRHFSNKVSSLQSSIGLFQANEAYSGRYGRALRLDGLEPGINHLARDRAIVIHGAEYVSNAWIEKHGRLGRSHGCPAVRKEIVHQVVDNLKDGQLLFTYYPDKKWLQSSQFLNCAVTTVTQSDRP